MLDVSGSARHAQQKRIVAYLSRVRSHGGQVSDRRTVASVKSVK